MEKPRIKYYGKVVPAVIDFPIEYLINFSNKTSNITRVEYDYRNS